MLITGRVQLIKFIIHGTLVILFMYDVYLWHVKLLQQLERWIIIFLQSGDIYSKKFCLVSWNALCLPWKSGDLDFFFFEEAKMEYITDLDLRSTRSNNEALIFHLSQKLHVEESQWYKMFKHQFFKHCQPISPHFKSSIWSGIKSHVGIVPASSI